MLAAGCAYWWATRRLGPRLVSPGEEVVSRRQQCWFYGGLAVLWAFSEWPVHDLAEDYLYSVHMVQHTMFSLIAPPMLLLGLPGWLVRWLVRNPVLGFLARNLARPVPAALLFNFLAVFLHWEVLVDAELASEPLHFALHVLLFTSSMCLWFPLVNSLPGLPRLSNPLKMVYVMAESVLPVAPVTFIALATKPIYHAYAAAPRAWGISAVADQQAAAGLMWLLSSLVMVGVLMYVFGHWWADEQRRPETRSWPERERLARPARAAVNN